MGFIIGAGVGLGLSIWFIFPDDVLNLKLVNMTIGDVLRILGGLMVIPLFGGIGGKICSSFSDWSAWEWVERAARIEKYGKWGSSRYRGHLADDEIEIEYKKTGIKKEKTMYKAMAILAVALTLYALQATAEQLPQAAAKIWRPVFVTTEGTRIDFIAQKQSFESQSDKASAYRFEFNVPPEGTHASIRLLPVGQNRGPSEDYDATIVMRGPDMIVLVMHNEGFQKGTKFEVYTLYPKLDIGFLTETSSFLGNPLMKELAKGSPAIPSASAKAFSLRRIDH